MLPRRHENLRERLLRAGVAPRHVQRYVRELSEHYDDALRAELSKGADLATAERAALQRLGTEDALVQSVLDRPELRSAAARFPALVFGVGPLITWIGVLVATFAVLHLVPQSSAAGAEPPGWLLDAAHALCIFYLRILPAVLGVVVFAAAARRRLRAYWPLAGAALVDLLAGSLTVHFLGAAGLGVSSSLLPWIVPFSEAFGPRDLVAFGEGLLRGACMLAVSAVAHRAVQGVSPSGTSA